MNALKLVLVVNSCAPIQSDRTTVAVAPDTDWTLMDILAMVYTHNINNSIMMRCSTIIIL